MARVGGKIKTTWFVPGFTSYFKGKNLHLPLSYIEIIQL